LLPGCPTAAVSVGAWSQPARPGRGSFLRRTPLRQYRVAVISPELVFRDRRLSRRGEVADGHVGQGAADGRADDAVFDAVLGVAPPALALAGRRTKRPSAGSSAAALHIRWTALRRSGLSHLAR